MLIQNRELSSHRLRVKVKKGWDKFNKSKISPNIKRKSALLYPFTLLLFIIMDAFTILAL